MLWKYSSEICQGILWVSLIMIALTGYAYAVNARRQADDPKKKDYNPYAIFIAPIAMPFLLGVAILIFILRALLFAVFIFAFTIALIVIRKPFIFIWLDKIATAIGEPLLEINTYILKLAFARWNPRLL